MTRSLIIDTDPGVDDAYAIALAAAAPEVDLLAVTTTFGNVGLERTTENARRVLGLLGRGDVPIGRGAERPLVHPVAGRAEDVHGRDGLGGVAERFTPLAAEPVGRAQDLLAVTIEDAPEPVVLATIGPLTNVALLLATRPDLTPRIARLVIMGGSVSWGGNVSAAAEFNVWSDPEAARRVLVEETVPTTLVPLDLTMRTVVGSPWLDELASSGPVGAALAATRRVHHGETEPIHDAVALLEAIVPGTLRCTSWPLEVDVSLGPSRGTTLADRRPNASGAGRPVDVALDAHVDAVRSELLRRLRLA